MKFHDLGGPIATEVEMVTLEDATASPWIVGLTPEPGSDSAGLECRLARVTEDTTSGSGVTVRTYGQPWGHRSGLKMRFNNF